MRIARDVVRVAGPEAGGFLQGQVSQDVERLATGSTAWAFLLEPQGKVDAWLRVTRTASDEFLLDVDEGYGGLVVERLDRFKLRVKATIEVVGPAPCEVTANADPGSPLSAIGPALPGETLPDAGWEDAWDEIRVRRGIPAMGREITPESIPEELGLVDVSVSFTKGCYTGQELVARIDSRGRNVPRRLRRVEAGSPIDAGSDLVHAGKVVGRVTTAVATSGLAIVARSVQPPEDVQVGSGGMARVEALPPLR